MKLEKQYKGSTLVSEIFGGSSVVVYFKGDRWMEEFEYCGQQNITLEELYDTLYDEAVEFCVDYFEGEETEGPEWEEFICDVEIRIELDDVELVLDFSGDVYSFAEEEEVEQPKTQETGGFPPIVFKCDCCGENVADWTFMPNGQTMCYGCKRDYEKF